MWTSPKSRFLSIATVLSLPLVYAQNISDSFPSCVSQCIDQSTDNSCSLSDIKCICRESNGNFLPDMVACIYGACDDTLDTNTLLTPLQAACDLAGTPISQTALQNAENLGSSLAVQSTTTVTPSATSGSAAPSETTLTETTTTGGSTIVIAYPATIGGNTIYLYGTPSTVTQTMPGSTTTASAAGFTGVIPVIIVSTNGAGSVYTSTTTEPGAVSTLTTTDSAGSTATVTSTYTQMAGGSGSGTPSMQTVTTTNSAGSTYTTTESGTAVGAGGASPSPSSSQSSGPSSMSSASSTTTATTSVEAQATTASTTTMTSSKTQGAAPSVNTNGSPFGMQSDAWSGKEASSWAGLGVFLVAVMLCF